GSTARCGCSPTLRRPNAAASLGTVAPRRRGTSGASGQEPVRLPDSGTKHSWHISRDESNIASGRGLSSGEPVQISIEFHRLIEMMEANQMLPWTVLRDRVRILPQIKDSSPEIEELHLPAPELGAAQQNRRADQLAGSI